MNKRIRLGIYTVLFFTLYPFWIISIAQDYQQAAQQAKEYLQDKGRAAIYEEPLYVNGKDTVSHLKGAPDYFLELREAGGRLRRVGVSEECWANVTQGDTVTGEVWRDKVRLVEVHGQFQQTASNPQNQAQKLGGALWKWSAIGVILAGILLYSNWYLYKNRYRLETERTDAEV